MRLPGQVGHGTARRGGTFLKAKGHQPLLMLDQRHPSPPAEDGGREFPRGTEATLPSEREGQCKIQLLFERAALAMSDPQRFTTYQMSSEQLQKKSKSQQLKSGEEKEIKINKMRPVDERVKRVGLTSLIGTSIKFIY